ncbi:hybrid sensor histidine kinase/response regulator [Hyalangium minutum]|uniref:histidine kinase n=1 Tax=Hyalangium minutum TaxID=394096 RepID=A0A085WM20_9BACT|nr:ATP-binding protein [Hyalangium minutum]KFE68733.1 Signal transduction histidine kinase [Hyalangium minutum]
MAEASPSPGERSLPEWVAAAVAALSPRDGKQLERVLEVARSACGADLALALRRVDAVTLFELGGAPAQHPSLPPVGESLFRGVLGGQGCSFFEPEQAEPGWPYSLRGAVALVPWESVEERRGAVLLVRRGTQSFSPDERGRLEALCGLLVTVARESDLERLTAGLRERVEAISHALPCGLIFLNPQEAEAWLNEPAAELLGLPAGKAPAHLVAQAMAALRERAVNRQELEVKLEHLFRGGASELRDVLWRFENPHRIFSVSCVLASRGPTRGRLWAFLDVTQAQDTLALLEQQNLALEAARREADAANAAKSQFLATMSHEIRTPMNGVLGMTHLLRRTPLSQEQQEYVDVIHTSGEALLTIINDILDFSKIEAGALELDSAAFSLRQTLDECVRLLSPSAEARGLYCRQEVEPTVPDTLVGDRMRLRQILLNLVGNALKFTHQGGVTVHVSRGEAPASGLPSEVRVCFAVSDTGIGIPAERMDRLFRTFSQVDSSTSRHYGGTGLGLVISQRLAQMMEGHIHVRSTEGVGSTFTLEVVLQEGSEASLPPRTEVDESLGARHPLRVLLVEDNPINQKVNLRVFQRLGYEAHVVGNGLEALAAMREAAYDVVFMDVHMPRLDGLEAARRVRADAAEYGSPYIVAMTASAVKGDRERCLQAGMNDYVAKPVEFPMLAAALERAAFARAQGLSLSLSPAPLQELASPEPSSANEAPVLQREILQRLELLVGNNREELGTLTRDFLKNARKHQEALLQGVLDRDARALGEHAHSLRSSAALFGASQLSRFCEELEQCAEAGFSDQLKALAKSTAQAFEQARAALEEAVPEACPARS